MRLEEAVQSYLVCIAAEGCPAPIAREYRYVFALFIAIVGDMEFMALSPEHLQGYMCIAPVRDAQELERHMAILRDLRRWFWAQRKLNRPISLLPQHLGKGGRWSPFPQQEAAKRNLPLAQ